MTRLLVIAAFSAACAAPVWTRLPRAVIDMYDRAAPDGWMEIEAERNGRILEIEADIPTADLPAAVREAGERALPGGMLTGAEYEIVRGNSAYEVKMTKDGRQYEFVFDSDGTLLESEKELRRGEAPAGLVEAALASVPGATFKSVEVIQVGAETTYHVKGRRDGASYKIVISPEGAIQRRVREARCEIEIPLR